MAATNLAPPITTSPVHSYVPPNLSNSQSPELSSGSGSTPSSSSVDGSGNGDDEADDDIWDMVDSLYSRMVPNELKQSRGRKLSLDLIAELDGATFGAGAHHGHDLSTNRVPLIFPRPPGASMEQLIIPHFPELTDALLGRRENTARAIRTAGESSKAPGGIRTLQSVPQTIFEAFFIDRSVEQISQGIQLDSEKEMLGHMTRERFQGLLDSQVRYSPLNRANGSFSRLFHCRTGRI